jgi:small subunit ribosomal protein S17
LKQSVIGIVKSAKAQKTLRVEVERRVRHPLYGKYIRKRTVCYVHDENEQAKEDDRVEISECRPRSKKKRWELVKVLARH